MSRLSAAFRQVDRRAWLITVPLFIATVLLTLAAQLGEPVPGWDWLIAVVFLITFIGAQLTVLQVEVRRHLFVISMSEVPLLLGLFYLSPVLLVTIVAAATLAVRSYQRQSTVKLWFNAALQAAGAALASLIVHTAFPLDGAEPATWLLLSAAVTASVLVNLAAVTSVVSLVQGRISSNDLWRTMVPGLPVAGLNIAVGLVVLVLLQQGPWSPVLLAAMISFLVVAYRSYTMLLRQSRALNEMYDLTRAIDRKSVV